MHVLKEERAGDVLAVVSQSGGTVSFFDAGSDAFLGDVEVPMEPHELCFDAERRLLWCATAYKSGYYHANSGRASELTAIDPDTRRVARTVRVEWWWSMRPPGRRSAGSTPGRRARTGSPSIRRGARVTPPTRR